MTGRLMLVVDDSPADRTSVRIAFERSGLPVSLSFAESAEKALAQLRASAEMPHMMLVDVQVTRGFESEIEAAVLCEQFQHVIQESNARGDLVNAPAFDAQVAADLRLFCDAFQFGFSQALSTPSI